MVREELFPAGSAIKGDGGGERIRSSSSSPAQRRRGPLLRGILLRLVLKIREGAAIESRGRVQREAMQPTDGEIQGMAASASSCLNGPGSRVRLQDLQDRPQPQEQQQQLQSSDLRQVDESPESSHDEFFDQILFSLPWTDLGYGNPKSPWDVTSPSAGQKFSGALAGKPSMEYQLTCGEGIQYPQLYDESLLLASRLRQNQLNGSGGASGIQLDRISQPQVLLSAGEGDLALLPLPLSPGNADSAASRLLLDGSRSDVDPSFKPSGPSGGEGMYKGFGGSLQGTSHLLAANPQHFNHAQAAVLPSQSFSCASTAAVAGSTPPKQKVRARRGQATDPHSIAERLRRERIAERMKALQELVPNANKTDKASMLDEIIDYVKFLQLQVKVLSMSRLGGAAPPFAADVSSKGENEGLTAAEQQVAKLMEEDMGAAMQYLQGKGLCLMPISLASAISAATTSSISDTSPSSANNPAF